MRNTEYVRGTLTPTNPELVNAWTMGELSDALGRAGIKSLRLNDLRETDHLVRGIVEFHDSHRSAGPGFIQDFLYRLRSFLQEPKVARFGLEGEILVISDYQRESPEIYNVIVKNGDATYKTAHVLWDIEEKRY